MVAAMITLTRESEMRILFKTVICGLFAFGVQAAAFAADAGTAAEAVAMVKKAADYLKANGKDKAIAEVNSPTSQFKDRDLYIVIYDMKGKNLAHGANPRMVGKDLIDLKDGDGKAFMKERVELMAAKDKAWQDYKFVNPVSKNIEQKSMYLERHGDLIIGCGIYKP